MLIIDAEIWGWYKECLPADGDARRLVPYGGGTTLRVDHARLSLPEGER